jgi:hypothetical protein
VTFILACVDSFRNAYIRTGMNLMQSIVVTAIEAGRQGWRALAAGKGGVRFLTGRR